MSLWLTSHSALLWAVLFVLAYFAIAVWETFSPKQPSRPGQGGRWVRSGFFHTIGLLATSFCFPIAASSVVDWAHLHQLGLFNQWQMPTALAAVLGVLLLDLGNYVLHRMMHVVPAFWRFHQIHHSDQELDCATDLLHHPVEVLLVGVLYFAQLVIWGLPYESVLVFALLGVLSGPWQHGNLRLPNRLQRYLGQVLVTPEMHSIHHSSSAIDGNRNFSVIFSWWDRAFGTYAMQPVSGWSTLRFGLAEKQNPGDVTFWKLLLEPVGAYRPAMSLQSTTHQWVARWGLTRGP
jgi:sterol desaturase/sphingolipid hydroxylase (fatty acid hydroxylase superfamily)